MYSVVGIRGRECILQWGSGAGSVFAVGVRGQGVYFAVGVRGQGVYFAMLKLDVTCSHSFVTAHFREEHLILSQKICSRQSYLG